VQIQVFSIPMEGDEEATEQLNRFLRTHKVLCIEKAAVIAQGRQFWSVCVEFLPRRPFAPAGESAGAAPYSDKARIDYRQVLSPAEFQRFNSLRQLRKQLADSESVPVYNLFTNAQLAELARKVPKSKSALAETEGLGEAKIAKYGEVLLGLLASLPAPEGSAAPTGRPGEPAGESAREPTMAHGG
jgi:superfamily II DNA helicase RecQ